MTTKSWNDIKAQKPTCVDERDAAHLENLAEDLGMPLAELRRFADLTQGRTRPPPPRHPTISVRN